MVISRRPGPSGLLQPLRSCSYRGGHKRSAQHQHSEGGALGPDGRILRRSSFPPAPLLLVGARYPTSGTALTAVSEGPGESDGRSLSNTVAVRRENALARKEDQRIVGTMVGIGGDLDEALMAHDSLLRAVIAPASDGGIAITDGEARRMRLHFYEAVAPAAMDASDGLSVIRSITSSRGGVRGERTRERIVNIWERRGVGRGRVLPFARNR